MPYIGKQPAEAALVSGDLGANIVDGTKTKDALIADYSDVTVTAADLIMYGDATDSNNTKRDTVQGILDLAGGWTLAAEQATTSGTGFTFGSIPTGTSQIIVQFEGVSLDDTDDILVQLGDAGGIETSGYVSSGHLDDASSANSTSGMRMISQDASEIINGHMILTLFNSSTFSWVMSYTASITTTVGSYGGGTKSLSAELTQVKILDTAGDAFDAGAITIMYM